MLMRRRPLLRAAMVGGVGVASYKAGQRAAQAPEAPAPAPPPLEAPAPATASGTDRVEALTRLKGLLDAGVLSQEEFDGEKQRILSGG